MQVSKMCNHCKLAGAFLISLTCVSEFSPSCRRVNSVPVCSMNPSKPASDNWLSLKFKTCKMERWYISLVAHPTRLLLSSTMPVTRFPLSHVTLNQVPIEVLVFQLAFTVQCGPLETTKKHQNILFCICYSQGLSRMKKRWQLTLTGNESWLDAYIGLFLYHLLHVMELMESVLQISFTIILLCESYAPYFSRARRCNQCDGLTSFVIVCLLYLGEFN